MTKEEKDSNQKRIKRIALAIINMNLGQTENCTNFARSIKIHPNTLRDILDLYDSLKEVGFITIRNKQGEVELIIRTDESLEFRNEIKEIKKIVKNIEKNLNNETSK